MWLIAAAVSAVVAVLLAWPVPGGPLRPPAWTRRFAARRDRPVAGGRTRRRPQRGQCPAAARLRALEPELDRREPVGPRPRRAVVSRGSPVVLATSALRIERDLRRQRIAVGPASAGRRGRRASCSTIQEPLAYCLPGPCNPRIVITVLGNLSAIAPRRKLAAGPRPRARPCRGAARVGSSSPSWPGKSDAPLLAPARRATGGGRRVGRDCWPTTAAAEATSRLAVARAWPASAPARPPASAPPAPTRRASLATPTSVIARVRRLTMNSKCSLTRTSGIPVFRLRTKPFHSGSLLPSLALGSSCAGTPSAAAFRWIAPGIPDGGKTRWGRSPRGCLIKPKHRMKQLICGARHSGEAALVSVSQYRRPLYPRRSRDSFADGGRGGTGPVRRGPFTHRYTRQAHGKSAP